MIKGIIFDFNRTLYDPETSSLAPGALEALDRLSEKGYKMCLLSKKTQEDRRERISELGLDKYFLDIQVIEGERREENFERCSRVMSLNNCEIAVVGDRIRSEITLGNRLGMATIWYKSGKFASETPRITEEKPDYTITALSEVLDCLIDWDE